jgi:hypothetical protein
VQIPQHQEIDKTLRVVQLIREKAPSATRLCEFTKIFFHMSDGMLYPLSLKIAISAHI